MDDGEEDEDDDTDDTDDLDSDDEKAPHRDVDPGDFGSNHTLEDIDLYLQDYIRILDQKIPDTGGKSFTTLQGENSQNFCRGSDDQKEGSSHRRMEKTLYHHVGYRSTFERYRFRQRVPT